MDEQLMPDDLRLLRIFLTRNRIKWINIHRNQSEYKVLGIYMNDGIAKGTWQFIYRSDKRQHLTVTKHLKKIVGIFQKESHA